MSLPNDTARCDGFNCPSRKNCRRYTERKAGSDYTAYAAFWSRREAGADACESIIPVTVISTFKDAG